MAICVKDIMTSHVICVSTEDIVTKVDDIFNNNVIHHIPVLSVGGDVVGIISKTDFERISAGLSMFKLTKRDDYNQALYRSLRAGEIMTKDAICISINNSMADAIQVFRKNKVRALPVLDGNNIKGIVTPYDVMVYFADNCSCR